MHVCRRGLFAALACLLFLAAPTADAQRADARVPSELIVRLAPEADITDLTAAARLSGEGLVAKRLLVPALGIWLVEFNEVGRDDLAARATLDAVRRTAAVQVAQFNHEVTLRSTEPDDSRFGDMWGLHNTGQSGGTPDADIDAPEAWDYLSGGVSAQGDRVAVGIVDSGFDLDHPDMDYWTNTAETPNNGIDDDGNGYVDDVNGWNAYSSSGNVTNSFHGSHVSGTAAGNGGNGIGITGVNWDAQAVAIQGSSGNESTVVEAYGYALALRQQYDATGGAEGAFIVSTNSSFGVDFADPDDFPIWCGFYDDLGQAGILSMGATMNRNADVDQTGDVPTACPSNYLVSVTNTTRTDDKNSGAAFGLTTIDLGAPGTSILSINSSGGYSNATGTSMATPHVAGAAAFLVSGMSGARLQEYKDNPGAVALDVKRALLLGTDDIGLETVSGGRLNLLGSLLESFEDDDRSDVIAASTTIADLALDGEYLYVPDGVTLTLTGSLTLGADADGNPSRLVVRGTVQGTVSQSITGGSEIVLRPGGQNLIDGTGAGSIDLTASATTSTTVAPGGSVSFAFSVTNSTPAGYAGDFYYTAMPGSASGLIRSGTLPSGATVSGTYTQIVPASTPPGIYTYTLSVGQMTGSFLARAVVEDSESFTITVTGSAIGDAPAWLAKDIAVEEEDAAASRSATVPAELGLAAYPNPFAGSTMIQVDLAASAEVQLVVYDVLGREVARLASGTMDAGQHTVVFNGRDLPSGSYVVRVTAGGSVQTQRITLLR
ncbi:MAG: S8 family peptidase [Bacteroidota bacterium]